MNSPKKLLLLLAAASAPMLLRAHDMWIEPATFSPEPGQIVSIKLRVGQELIGDPLPRDPSLINQFVVEDAAGRKPVVGRDGANPAGFVRVGGPGLLVIGYRSNPSPVEQTAEKFNQYLKEEGLEAIAALRARRNQTNAPVRELFARCAKSLVLSGPAGQLKLQGDRALGFTLELVAERNPYTLGAGEELPVRLTYENRPVAGALVVAMNRMNPAAKISGRTGADGRVKLRLGAGGGMWLIKSVYMAPAAAGAGADWMSYWASLTFDRRPAAATAAIR
jgi:uncharacterized GH25 family protein